MPLHMVVITPKALAGCWWRLDGVSQATSAVTGSGLLRIIDGKVLTLVPCAACGAGHCLWIPNVRVADVLGIVLLVEVA